jgi:hypothetical protein
MAELRATDITIADRLSTQLQLELKIKELSEKLQRTEAELEKFKTTIVVETDPNAKLHRVALEINGRVKEAKFTAQAVDHYLLNSEPVDAIITDILDLVVIPYREVVANEIREKIAAIVKNRMIENKGSAL